MRKKEEVKEWISVNEIHRETGNFICNECKEEVSAGVVEDGKVYHLECFKELGNKVYNKLDERNGKGKDDG